MAVNTRKKRRKKPRKAANPCIKCPSLCCHDLVTPVDKPRNKEDRDDLLWQLRYDTVSVVICNLRWHVVAKGRCIYLDKDNMCKIYDDRPDKCRKLNPPDCEKFMPWADVRFTRPEELAEYFEKEKRRLKRRRLKRLKSNRR